MLLIVDGNKKELGVDQFNNMCLLDVGSPISLEFWFSNRINSISNQIVHVASTTILETAKQS
jgi:hypothetical protein